MISNRLKQEPRTGYGTRMTVRKRGRVSEASDRVRMSQGRREEVRTNEAQDYGQTEQPRGQSSYLRPQEIPRNSQVMSLNSPIRTSAAPISPERLYAKHIEAYVQQRQAYERARAEALRERERLMQQRRRDEYERAKIYEQELQRYQQAIQSAQNRVLKERINEADVWRQQQQLLPRQYLNSGQGQIATFNRSLPESIRTPEDVRRTKLKHRKLLNFEKLKQIEKNRKILKTTPKPPQHIWWAQQQQQSQTRSENIVQEQQQLQRQNWSDQAKQLERGHQANQRDSEYEREPLHIPHLQHQQAQSYQTSLDSYQVEGQGQRKVITSNVGSMSATSESMKKVSQLIDRPGRFLFFELLNI